MKLKFAGWEEVIAVDFTRTADSVARTGANLDAWARAQDTKADLTALFIPRQPPVPRQEALDLMKEWNEDLEVRNTFKNKKNLEAGYGIF